jgi:hypothetical protein
MPQSDRCMSWVFVTTEVRQVASVPGHVTDSGTIGNWLAVVPTGAARYHRLRCRTVRAPADTCLAFREGNQN